MRVICDRECKWNCADDNSCTRYKVELDESSCCKNYEKDEVTEDGNC